MPSQCYESQCDPCKLPNDPRRLLQEILCTLNNAIDYEFRVIDSQCFVEQANQNSRWIRTTGIPVQNGVPGAPVTYWIPDATGIPQDNPPPNPIPCPDAGYADIIDVPLCDPLA